MTTPTELEKHVSDVVLGALQKDSAKGWVVSAEGRQDIIKLFASFTSYETAQAAAQEMMRCALYVHKHLQCKSAAVDLMNTFALIGPAPGRAVPIKNAEDSRRVAASQFLGSPRKSTPRDGEAGATTSWWQLIAK